MHDLCVCVVNLVGEGVKGGGGVYAQYDAYLINVAKCCCKLSRGRFEYAETGARSVARPLRASHKGRRKKSGSFG